MDDLNEQRQQRIKKLDALREGVSVGEAARVIAFLADLETFGRLVREHGWTFDGAERWVAETLARLLLRSH